MRGLLVLAGALGRAVEIAGHHVPADPPFREMIERRHPPRKSIGRLIGKVGGHPKTEIFGDRGHRRDQEQGIVARRLRGVAQGRIRAAAEHVIDPEHVGEKQSVEPPALQRSGEIEPVGQPVIFRRAVARMGPQPRRLMRDAVHGEGVEPDFFFHEAEPWDGCFRPVERRAVGGICCIPAGFSKANRARWRRAPRSIYPVSRAEQYWQTRRQPWSFASQNSCPVAPRYQVSRIKVWRRSFHARHIVRLSGGGR